VGLYLRDSLGADGDSDQTFPTFLTVAIAKTYKVLAGYQV
jgi:hypothetical protein